MAEHNFTQAVQIADHSYVIVHGMIAVEGRSSEKFNNNDLIGKHYLRL
jgi:ABC-type lipopolysaccharide export system ATPase subunit